MNLNRSQLSLLITFLTMSIVVLALYSIHLGGQQEEEYVIEMMAEDDVQQLVEEEQQQQQDLAQADLIKTHQAYNETAKPSYGNPEPLKTLEELMEEQAAQETADEMSGDYGMGDADFAARVKALAEKRKLKEEQLGERDAKKQEFTNYLADKRTSISYSLIDRNAGALPPPIYTCIEGGRVVINIKVDAEGNVLEAEFNAKSSSTSNGCLVDNAIAYAYRAHFSDAPSKPEQIGTITYIFQSK